MNGITETSVRLKRRPNGAPTREDFEVVTAPPAAPGEGALLVRALFASVDPAMRKRIDEADSYRPPFAIGDVVGTYSVGEVLESRDPGFVPGDVVWSFAGWRSHPVIRAKAAWKVDTDGLSPSAYLGVLGLTGFTAWIALDTILKLTEGETVVISAASGAVGSIAGQLAKLAGARVVGITSGAARCAHLLTLGFDAAIDRNGGDIGTALDAACPAGVDGFLDNTGAEIQHVVLARMNINGRVALCGLIADYNAASPPPGPNLWVAIARRLLLKGFLAGDDLARMPEYHAFAAPLVRDGTLRGDETIVDGLEHAPEAFAALLRGDKLGKQVVRILGT